jgi:lipoprotein-anchoring transpeptidase ErfK/SrfK
MQRMIATALLASALGTTQAHAQFMPAQSDTYRNARQTQYAQPARGNLGGGFIELLFGDGPPPQRAGISPQLPYDVVAPSRRLAAYPPADEVQRQAARYEMDPAYLRQVVDYPGNQSAGTIIIDTPKRFLYLVLDDGKALRYGIGVGRPGFTWAGIKQVTAKREWPDWRPPDEMLRRRPDLPRYMAGGPENPLGARAMYLGNTLYRIHGSNEPWTIGTQVSSGCIRMRNEDVIDLYTRVKVGTKVVVI